MRTANSHMDLAVIHARRGDLDEAVHHGMTAFGFERKTEASLLSRAVDLNRILAERYPRERLAENFRERYLDARRALRSRNHSDAEQPTNGTGSTQPPCTQHSTQPPALPN